MDIFSVITSLYVTVKRPSYLFQVDSPMPETLHIFHKKYYKIDKNISMEISTDLLTSEFNDLLSVCCNKDVMYNFNRDLEDNSI